MLAYVPYMDPMGMMIQIFKCDLTSKLESSNGDS